MDEIKQIQQQIDEKKHRKKRKKSPVFHFFMILFMVLSLGIGFLIYARIDENGTFFNRIFHTNVNFTEMNQAISRVLDRMFNFNLFGGKKDNRPVSGTISYIPLEDDYYKAEDQRVLMLQDGIISYLDQDDDGTFVVVSYENGVNASYFGLFDPLVKVLDELDVGDQIASYETSFKVIFFKGNEKISYEEAQL